MTNKNDTTNSRVGSTYSKVVTDPNDLFQLGGTKNEFSYSATASINCGCNYHGDYRNNNKQSQIIKLYKNAVERSDYIGQQYSKSPLKVLNKRIRRDYLEKIIEAGISPNSYAKAIDTDKGGQLKKFDAIINNLNSSAGVNIWNTGEGHER